MSECIINKMNRSGANVASLEVDCWIRIPNSRAGIHGGRDRDKGLNGASMSRGLLILKECLGRGYWIGAEKFQCAVSNLMQEEWSGGGTSRRLAVMKRAKSGVQSEREDR